MNGPDVETESALLSYIQKTRQIIADKPEIVASQQNSNQMTEMFDYLLSNWSSNRIQAIKVLAEKEKQLSKQGFINYNNSDLSISDVTKNVGFFNVLAEIYKDEINELDGLFSRIKERSAEKKEERKDKIRRLIGKVNKFNPITLAVRNALRGLLALNFLGVSTILMQTDARSEAVFEKVKRMYKTMGGKESKLLETLTKSKNKKPLFNKKMQQELEAGTFKGIDGLAGGGIGTMLTAAGAFFLKIWTWIKENGLNVAEKVKDILPERKETNEEIKKSSGKRNDINYGADNTSKDTKINKWKKPLIAIGVLAGTFGIAYGVYNHNNKQKEEKKVVRKKETKLGDIAFQ